ncbi:hypothetical protein [Vallitalea guaymasensis]|uniref:hypothetical protein n=1 Tax=Vallitalea guaymasensis TaxID=1185412 RepID=UPI000DE29437|nr:hypothetical protein [Vallitalea guaymasensis]
MNKRIKKKREKRKKERAMRGIEFSIKVQEEFNQAFPISQEAKEFIKQHSVKNSVTVTQSLDDFNLTTEELEELKLKYKAHPTQIGKSFNHRKVIRGVKLI